MNRLASLCALSCVCSKLMALGAIPEHLDSMLRTEQIQTVNVYSNAKTPTTSSSPTFKIGQDDILNHGITDISDALHRLPGITLKDYGGAGGMKTVSVRGLGSQHTGVSYDGILLSDCQTGQIDLQRYSLDNVNSIELNIGSNDDIFVPARNNSSAVLLKISTISSSLQDYNIGPQKLKAKAAFTYGAWGFVNPMFDISLPLSQKATLSVNADYTNTKNNYKFKLKNGMQTTTEHRTNNDMEQLHTEIGSRIAFSNRSLLTFKTYYYDNNRRLPGMVRYYTDINDENLRERNFFAQTQFKTILTDKFSIMINGKWNWATSDYTNGMPSGGASSAEYWQREGYLSTALLFTPNNWLAFDYSADYIMNNFNSSLLNIAKPIRHSLLQSLSTKMTFSRVTLTAKCLFSTISQSNRSESSDAFSNEFKATPSANISYKILHNHDLYLRASYKSIFRMPTFNELYYYHLGSQDLKPETTSQFNLGISHNFKSGPLDINYSLDGYFNRVTDKIVSIPINVFVCRTINVGKTRCIGVDFATDIFYHISPKHQLELSGNVSYQKIEDCTNKQSAYYKNQIAYYPTLIGSTTLSWYNPLVNVSVTGDGMNERWTTNEHYDDTNLEGHFELSASMFRNFNIKNNTLTLKGSVTNILNKQYEIVARYPMPGTGWKFSIIYKL